MSTVAVVPVKALAEAKSRLAGALSPAERGAAALQFARHVVGAILDSRAVDRCAVISPDPVVLALAATLGAEPLAQTSSGLNPALEEARAWAIGAGADALLIVLGDLPWVTPADIAAIVAAAEPGPAVVLAPDHYGTGSNALLLAPPAAIPFRFGRDSAAQHTLVAAQRGVPLRRYVSPTVAFDVDTPADLAAWRAVAVRAPVEESV